MTQDPLEFAEVVALAAEEIADQDTLPDTVAKIVDLAVKSLPCGAASIWELTPAGDEVKLVASSDVGLMTGVAAVKRHRQGIGWLAIDAQQIVECSDFRTERRWPGYTSWMLEHTPFRSAVAFPLLDSGAHLGALTVYDKEPGHFSQDIVRAGCVFATHAGVALHDAVQTSRAENLYVALQSNRRIGIAIGILMRDQRVSDQAAFELLRQVSQQRHRKLSDVAELVIETGTLLPD